MTDEDTKLTWNEVVDVMPVDERRKVGEMCCGIDVYRQCESLLLIPTGNIRVLTGAHHRYSYVQSPQAVTNNTSVGIRVESCIMGKKLDVNDAYTDERQRRMGLDPSRTVTFGTAAHMDNAVITNTVSRNGIRVSAAVTGGIRGNGGRAGDPASFDEAVRYQQHHGTIVVLLAIDAKVKDGSMLTAMLTATQAKSTVIQELMARSLYSPRIATGSGTDQVGVMSNSDSETVVDDCGAASDVGIAIAECVRESLFRAFDLQTAMNFEDQCDPFVILSRFGITQEMINDEIRFPCTMASLREAEAEMHKDRRMAAVYSSVLQIADEIRLGKIDAAEGLSAARTMTESVLLEKGDVDPVFSRILSYEDTIPGYLSLITAIIIRKRARAIMEGC